MNLPKDFQDKMMRLLKEDYKSYLNGFTQKYEQTLRVNQLKTEPADFIRRFLLEPVPWCENGFYYKGSHRLSAHPYYYGGVYYLQEPSAMAPAAFLPVCPGDKVLDLCAAPGGKTTALAAKLNGRGVLIANDLSVSRCKALLKNVEMAGVRNVMITCESPEKLAPYFSEYFDKILVDAPCSGEGMFRKEPFMAKSWSLEEVERYSRIQKEILFYAAKMLKPGGYLLYSTCTYSPEENEQVVEELLKQDASISLVELPLPDGADQGHPEWSLSKKEELKYCRRFWNHRVRGEGQFAALMQKRTGEGEEVYDPGDQERNSIVPHSFEKGEKGNIAVSFSDKKKNKKKSRKNQQEDSEKENRISKEMEDFLRHCRIVIVEQQLRFLEERAFLLPEGLPDMSKIRLIRSGLYLGDCKKKRFEPSQALAMALKPEEYDNVISLTVHDERVEKYLRCETIEAQAKDGWALVCVDEFPLGWGKCKNGIVKNKYAPGWRKGSL